MSVGVGFYTECEEDIEAKQIIDDWCQQVGLDQVLHNVVRTMLTYGFCPVERWAVQGPPPGALRLKLLPPESVKVRINRKGQILGYRQELITEPVAFRPQDLIFFVWDRIGADPYGTSKVAPILTLLETKRQTNEDMSKIIHRYAAPLSLWKSRNSVATLKKAVQNREPDEDVFLGNIEPDDVTFDTVQIDPRGKFEDYINQVNDQILEGLQAPLLHYLRNATEASATKMLEVIDRHIQGIQRYVKRVVETEMFAVVLAFHGKTRPEQIPRIQWGSKRTPIEELDLGGIADLVSSGALGPDQAQDLLRKMGIPLEEPEEKPEEPEAPLKGKQVPKPSGTGTGNGDKERVKRMVEKALKVTIQ
jgi:hypothetical protein